MTSSELPAKAKVVLFYKNGDRNFRGYHISVTPRRFKYFDSLLSELTRVINLPQGARYIFGVDGQAITSLDQLEDGASYVASSHHKFKKINYGAAPDGGERKLKTRSFIPAHAQTPMEVHDVVSKPNVNIKPKIITVIRNGRPGMRPSVKILLNKRTAQTYDQVLNDITSAVGVSGGSGVRRLFTAEGLLVMSLSELFSEGDVFVAVGSEKFYPDEIDDMLSEHRIKSKNKLNETVPPKPTKKRTKKKSKELQRDSTRRMSVDASTFPRAHKESLSKHKVLPSLRKMSASHDSLLVDHAYESDANNNNNNTVSAPPAITNGIDHVTFDATELNDIESKTEQISIEENRTITNSNTVPDFPVEDAGKTNPDDKTDNINISLENKLPSEKSSEPSDKTYTKEEPTNVLDNVASVDKDTGNISSASDQTVDAVESGVVVTETEGGDAEKKSNATYSVNSRTSVEDEIVINSIEIHAGEDITDTQALINSEADEPSTPVAPAPEEPEKIETPPPPYKSPSPKPAEVSNVPSPMPANIEVQNPPAVDELGGTSTSEETKKDAAILDDAQESQPAPTKKRDSISPRDRADSKIPVRKNTPTSSEDLLNSSLNNSKLGDHKREITDSKEIQDMFELGRKLGDGNFAIVKVATDKKTKEEFALKIIDRSKVRGKEEMLDNEIRIQLDCNHPNICSLYEDIHSPTDIYLVMELVTGGDYFDLVSNNIKFEEDEAAYYIRDLCSALDYLHKLRIVHRDIKPENLMVTNLPSGKKRLKLADFGLAMKVTAPIFAVCGTPTYVAPEILTEEGYGLEVDVWAAGVIMYISLCGFPPFRSNRRSQTELFDIIESGEFEFLAPYWDDASEEAKDLISNILVVDRKKRYTCAQVMKHAWMKKHGLTRTNTLDDISPRKTSEKKKRRASARFRTAVITVQTIERMKRIKDMKMDRGERLVTPTKVKKSADEQG